MQVRIGSIEIVRLLKRLERLKVFACKEAQAVAAEAKHRDASRTSRHGQSKRQMPGALPSGCHALKLSNETQRDLERLLGLQKLIPFGIVVLRNEWFLFHCCCRGGRCSCLLCES